MVAPALTPEQLLARYSPGIRALAASLRRLVCVTVPEASEYVNAGWGALGYRHPEAGYFCGVFPFADHVKLLFEHGADVSYHDPHVPLFAGMRKNVGSAEQGACTWL